MSSERLTSKMHYATKFSLWMDDSTKILSVIILFFILLFSTAPSYCQSKDYTDQDCLFCHGKPEISQITKEGKVRSLYVNPEEWSQDIHCQGQMGCVDCHINANLNLHFREGFIDVDCARCHPAEAEEYQKNIHLTFLEASPGKELPLCYHCHTKHHVLPHDNPSSSVHESRVAETCGSCHPEVMVEKILDGTPLGKISGHRKGDLSDKFDMKVCLDCHYEDSAHGTKRVYKDFCVRCHEVRSKGNAIMGPTHLNDTRWAGLNHVGNGLFILLFFGSASFLFYRSRHGIKQKFARWRQSMIQAAEPEEEKKAKEKIEKEEGRNPEIKETPSSKNGEEREGHEN
jgi:hypothetical protein